MLRNPRASRQIKKNTAEFESFDWEDRHEESLIDVRNIVEDKIIRGCKFSIIDEFEKVVKTTKGGDKKNIDLHNVSFINDDDLNIINDDDFIRIKLSYCNLRSLLAINSDCLQTLHMHCFIGLDIIVL